MSTQKNTSDSDVVEKKRISGFSYGLIATLAFLGILLSVNQIFYLKLFGFAPIGNAYYYYVLAIFLSLAFLIYPAREREKYKIPWYDWILFILCVVVNVFLASSAFDILTKGWEYDAPWAQTIAGGMLWLLAVEGARRAGGTNLFIICAVFSVFPLFADYMPGVLWGTELSLKETMCYYSMGVEAIIGIPTRIVANLVIGFIVFGVALVTSGGGKFFMDFALSLMGRKRGGAAKVSVISSSLMASLSGSVISNIITTGSMTIPAMKKTGYEPKYAAAIEACASTGGAIMPPVMGAAGFLIASFLNVPYKYVMIAAFFPALLYYVVLYVQVDLYADRMNLVGLNAEDLPDLRNVMRKGWFFLGALVLLIFILVVLRVEAWAPFYTILFLFACAMIYKETRLTWPKFIAFLVESGKLLANLVAILAGVGLIIGSLSATGVANSFSREILYIAGDNVYLLLLFGALTSFVLGIGMTITACYVFLAIVLVPALVGQGLNPMACHIFVLYWGLLSYLTPPVALGSITAATIADSPPMQTGLLSMKLGAATYIVPFLFVLNPTLIFAGEWQEIALAVPTGLAGAVLLAASMEGYFYRMGYLTFVGRVLLFGAGVLFLAAGTYSDLIALVCVLILFAMWKVFPIVVVKTR